MTGVDGKHPERSATAPKNGAGSSAPLAPRRRVPFRAADEASPFSLRQCGSLSARTSMRRISGCLTNSWDALDISCFASLPCRWASRPCSFAKASNMPKVLISHPDCEPGCRLRLVVDHRSGARQKGRDLLLHSGLGFELDVKRMLRSLASPLVTPTKIAKAEVRLYRGDY